MMTLNEIKENLCYNDLRNPDATVDEETAKEIAENNAVCYCHNCFRGKTAMAEELLRYYYILNQKSQTN
jgi:hypothetical protein